jgi:hypothetical protein
MIPARMLDAKTPYEHRQPLGCKTKIGAFVSRTDQARHPLGGGASLKLREADNLIPEFDLEAHERAESATRLNLPFKYHRVFGKREIGSCRNPRSSITIGIGLA